MAYRKGIDLSTFQKEVNYQELKNQGIEFAIIRCGYGKEERQKDLMFETHYKGLKSVGIHVGSYLYSYCTSIENSYKEAQNCLKFIQGKQFELPIFIDLEEERTSKLGKDGVTQVALNFCKTIEEHGYKAGVYANLNWFKNFINVKELLHYSIWLAQWSGSHNEDFRVDFWQYTSSGKILGINGNVDLNYDLRENNNIIPESPKKLSNEEIAKQVIAGDWDNGQARKDNLTNAGYNAEEIQNLVNQMMSSSNNVYVVKKGDNLTKIAKAYGTTVAKLVKLNNIKDKNKIIVGQKIKIR